jgi:hypothetical protein
MDIQKQPGSGGRGGFGGGSSGGVDLAAEAADLVVDLAEASEVARVEVGNRPLKTSCKLQLFFCDYMSLLAKNTSFIMLYTGNIIIHQ